MESTFVAATSGTKWESLCFIMPTGLPLGNNNQFFVETNGLDISVGRFPFLAGNVCRLVLPVLAELHLEPIDIWNLLFNLCFSFIYLRFIF